MSEREQRPGGSEGVGTGGLRGVWLWLRVAGRGLKIEGCGVRVEDCGLRVEDCGLRVEGCGLQVEGCGLRVEGGRAARAREIPFDLRGTPAHARAPACTST